MRPSKNIVGKTFGKLLILEEYRSDKDNTLRCKYRCSCGTEGEARRGNILKGHTTSCGCYKKEEAK